MSDEPKLTFVVPTRNSRLIIGATLDSIGRQTFRDFTCLLIDGRSNDGTVEFVREKYPWVTVIVKDVDSGPGASRTIGMLRSRSPFIALVDSDVQLKPDWAEKQLRAMEQYPRSGISGSRVVYGRNQDILYSTFGAMNRYGVSWDGGQGEPVDGHLELRRCIWCNTSALMIRREVVLTAGTFDDRMYAFCEDSDFGWRVNFCGYDAIYNPEAVAIHDVHGSFDPERHKELFVYLLRRNRIRSLLVNYQASSIVRFVVPYIGMALLESLRGPGRWWKLKAIAWNFLNLPEILRRRRYIQGLRTVGDGELWPLFAPGIRGPGGDALVRLQNPLSPKKSAVPQAAKARV